VGAVSTHLHSSIGLPETAHTEVVFQHHKAIKELGEYNSMTGLSKLFFAVEE